MGVWIITYSVTANSKNIAYIITGLILVGIIPIEEVIRGTVNLSDKRKQRREGHSSASQTSSPSSPESPGSSLP